MTLTKCRKLRQIKITVEFMFTEVKYCIMVVNFMYPTAFHSFQCPKCYTVQEIYEQSSRT